MNEFQEIMKRQNKTAIEVMNIAAHEVAVENMGTEDYETWEQGEKLRDAEIARLQRVEQAAKNVLDSFPEFREDSEMLALAAALKGETK